MADILLFLLKQYPKRFSAKRGEDLDLIFLCFFF